MRTLITLSVLFLPAAAQATTADLIRAQHTDIGDVTVTDDGSTLTVSVEADTDWAWSEIHVAAGCDVSDIPSTKKGNPKPGLFPAGDSDVCEDDGTWTFDLDDLDCSGEVVVAVHTVSVDVTEYEVGDLTSVSPLTASGNTVGVGSQLGDFYLRATTGGTTYGAYCVDLDHFITPGRTYSGVDAYSSYDTAANAFVDKPANLDLVNYILNTDYSSLGATMGNYQNAIWILIDDGKTRVSAKASITDAIVADAKANGEGFEPDVGDVYAVLLVQDGNGDGEQDIQVLAIPVDAPTDPVCGEDTETAWASGDRFVKKGSWATYITHSLGGSSSR